MLLLKRAPEGVVMSALPWALCGIRATRLRYPTELGSEPEIHRAIPTAAMAGPGMRSQ
jgi:hypothetical protein